MSDLAAGREALAAGREAIEAHLARLEMGTAQLAIMGVGESRRDDKVTMGMGGWIAVRMANDFLNPDKAQLIVYDIKQENLDRAREIFEDEVFKKIPTWRGRVLFTTNIRDIDLRTDAVIEAIVEDLDIKVPVMEQVSRQVSGSCLMFTNSSNYMPSQVFARVPNQQRCHGWHFFNQPGGRRANHVIENITRAGGDRELSTRLHHLLLGAGMHVLDVNERPAAALNVGFESEYHALMIMRDRLGLSPKGVDTAINPKVGHNPFFVADFIGMTRIQVVAEQLLRNHEGKGWMGDSAETLLELAESGDKWLALEGRDLTDDEVTMLQEVIMAVVLAIQGAVIDSGDVTSGPDAYNRAVRNAFKTVSIYELLEAAGGKEGARKLIAKANEHFPGLPIPRWLSAHSSVVIPERERVVELRDSGIPGVALVVLVRPHMMNSLYQEVLEDLYSLMQEVEQDPSIKAVVLTGEVVFCAGANINQVREGAVAKNLEPAVQYMDFGEMVMRYIEDMETIVVMAVHGLAMGGGFELATRGHYLLGATNASMTYSEISLGWIPGWGGNVLSLWRMMGHANDLIARIRSGAPVTAVEGLEWGFFQELAAPGRLIHRAIEVACELIADPSKLVRIDRSAVIELKLPDQLPASTICDVHKGISVVPAADGILVELYPGLNGKNLDEGMVAERDAFGRVMLTDDALIGPNAFLKIDGGERGKPQFTGK